VLSCQGAVAARDGHAGLFSLSRAVFNWDRFMMHDRASLFIPLLGMNGARVLCAWPGGLLAARGLPEPFGLLG
jgi:hypothetical protein